MNVLEFINGLADKESLPTILNKAVRDSYIPRELIDDAKQEILLDLHCARVDEKRSVNEILSYAHKTAFAAALRIRRLLGSPFKLPAQGAKDVDAFYAELEESDNEVFTHFGLEHFGKDGGCQEDEISKKVKGDKVQQVYNKLNKCNRAVLELVIAGESRFAIADTVDKTERRIYQQLAEITKICASA